MAFIAQRLARPGPLFYFVFGVLCLREENDVRAVFQALSERSLGECVVRSKRSH